MDELNENYVVCEYERGTAKRDFIRGKIEHPEDREARDDGFIVLDFGDVIAKHVKWTELLPRVRPFYVERPLWAATHLNISSMSAAVHVVGDNTTMPQERTTLILRYLRKHAPSVPQRNKYLTDVLVPLVCSTAVKCRPFIPILKVMNALGIGFDCASKPEIESVLSLGVDPKRVVYSHTRKQVSTLEYAANNNVDLMTFDDEHELLKIKRVFPSARLLLRFALYDSTAAYPQGLKYGCKRETALMLLQLAKKLDLNVVGIHFHIGSESKKPTNYHKAIAYSRELFDVAEKLGFQNMTVLDIGGGFPGYAVSTGKFNEYAEAVSEAIDEFFPKECKVDIVAEPGTYYMKSAVTVVTSIIGKRKRIDGDSGVTSLITIGSSNESNARKTSFDYYLNEGRYTSFINSVYEPMPTPQPLKDIDDKTKYNGAVYGYTCCETDVIIPSTSLPELDEGDWVFFQDFGNYTHLVTYFNGFKRPFCYYAIPDDCRQLRHAIEDEVLSKEETVNGNDLLPTDPSLLE